MHVRADGEALVTGSADKDVKFWKFEHRDATDGSVSAEMVVLTLLPTNVLGSEWKTFIATPHTYIEDDGRCVICPIQPQQQTIGSGSP
jgi:hypothetical protein